MKKYLLTLILMTTGLAINAASVVSKTFENGLQVFVKPDHRVPLALVQVWYKVGSKDEVDGLTGIAHFLEHLMFMGTKQFPGGLYSTRISALGGTENAQTNRDYTMYFQTVPSDQVDKVLGYEADRMTGLVLEKDRVDREREVVAEERRMRMEDRPEHLAYEQLMAMIHLRGPYHHMPIGWMSDIAQYTMQDAQHWYDQWYTPNNAVLVIVGDVQPDAVFASVEKHFGSLQAKPLPIIKQKPDAPLRGKQLLKMKDKRMVGKTVMLSFLAPSLRSVGKEKWRSYALSVLTAIMAYGESSRLEQALKFKRHIVRSVWAGYDADSYYDGELNIGLELLPKVTFAKAKKVLEKEFSRLGTASVSQSELERAKAQILAAHTYGQDGLSSVARAIGLYAVLGLSQQERVEFARHIEAVTAQQVKEVAKTYLKSETSVEGDLSELE